jgi:hypothetical protein
MHRSKITEALRSNCLKIGVTWIESGDRASGGIAAGRVGRAACHQRAQLGVS